MVKCDCCNSEMKPVGDCYCDNCGNDRFYPSKDKKRAKCYICGKIFVVGELPTKYYEKS